MMEIKPTETVWVITQTSSGYCLTEVSSGQRMVTGSEFVEQYDNEDAALLRIIELDPEI